MAAKTPGLHHMLRERRSLMADQVRSGRAVSLVAAEFGVAVQTVYVGCTENDVVPAPRIPDVSGQRFGKLIALRVVCRIRRTKYLCACDCGNQAVVIYEHLRTGGTKSCGCLKKTVGRLIAKGAKSPTFMTWRKMHSRCENPKWSGFERYGGRGIVVCDRWSSFANFLADMGEKPHGTSIDRIDNDGNYEPANCRWADNKTQCRNKSNNRIVVAFGERKTLIEWTEDERCAVGEHALRNRLGAGRFAESAITEPANMNKRVSG